MTNNVTISDFLGNDLIGFVLSDASVTAIPISIFAGQPATSIRTETLALVHDEEHPGTPIILGVVRWIRRLEPYLRPRVKVGVEEYPDAIDRIEKLTYTNVYVIPIAEIATQDNRIAGISWNVTYVPFPGSKVYRVRRGDLLTSLIASSLTEMQSPLVVGTHKYSGDVEVPLDPRYIQYHIGIFGATGMGKSRLAKVLIDEIVQKTEFSVIIFDHTGMDYTVFYPDTTITSLEVDLGPSGIADFFMETLRLSDYYSTYLECFSIELKKCMEGQEEKPEPVDIESYRKGLSQVHRDAYVGQSATKLREFIQKYKKELKSTVDTEGRSKLLNDIHANMTELLKRVASKLGARPETVENLAWRMSYFIKPEDLEIMLLRRERPIGALFDLARDAKRQGKPLVIDLSFEYTLEMKKAIIGDIIDYGWRWIYRENFLSGKHRYVPINTVIVIDEAQNYAWGSDYCEGQVEKIAREGRKWGYGLIVLSQRLAGSVDPDIRANLNTVFFSRLSQTTDLKEIREFADIAGIDESDLAQLMPREFYVAGLMSPLRKPIAIRVREVK
ncbi:MAG: ATP-binding protein [Crenarchaeota archaeon]|nr:ATP-binding protein [Thermoproteota archaeon]MCR8455775.1 ATP-binding protein [Thermoproteota archaeon]MCR8487157.1 ATP-binding protein [Thermoproteota archaeon]